MLTTSEALDAILAATPSAATESIAASESCGRVLQQPILAERDQPPFDRVMMDGIAIAASGFASGQRDFPIQGLQAAGDDVLSLVAGQCIEIMTGAALPEHADCIVPVERLTVAAGVACIEENYEAISGRYIHARGSDCARSAQLLSPGKKISPLDVAVIASCGETDVDVAVDPVVRVISTGNELIAAGQPIMAQQIRLSNGPAIVALLRSNGFHQCSHDHVLDDVEILRERITVHLSEASVLVLSGGVSMGKADFVPEVLADLGVERIFHKVSQRPGKPMWFGKGPRGQRVFALPGNPVSALICCRQYVVESLIRGSGEVEQAPEFAALATSVSFKPALTCFQPVKLLSSAAGQVLAMPVKTNTSGDFAALSATDGYVTLAKDDENFPSGTPVFLNRWIVR